MECRLHCCLSDEEGESLRPGVPHFRANQDCRRQHHQVQSPVDAQDGSYSIAALGLGVELLGDDENDIMKVLLAVFEPLLNR